MSRQTLERLAPWLTITAFVALWWLIVIVFDIKSYILPTPAETVQSLIKYRWPLFINGMATLVTTLIGFGVAVVIGMILGIFVGSSRLAYKALYPLLVGFHSVPKAAPIPVLVVW